ncbi:GNAT family N-acetyltransferase [Sphingomonas qomolangmaensis]|uniref:GNAT family N-acetyltransferase n=1 Tax=Sphingomonas qomolangmaensis TaxID=2918765 RepID=A0ABY5L322_9SPHN|nr:GNAT family N-acetyltransferase [Sphingomonas qomolangmaensis]UUL81343.1 GNAT family N-acetyltransferase [Sphingomonas qomolangmaensis]
MTLASIEVSDAPSDGERAAILAVLNAYNDQAGPPIEQRLVAVTVRDDAGAIVGGLWGRIAYRWLFVQYLALPPMMRGQGVGSRLMRAAEDEALGSGCVGVWLDTFSFQAQGFYERLGYAPFARIDDYPPGESRIFLRKRLG